MASIALALFLFLLIGVDLPQTASANGDHHHGFRAAVTRMHHQSSGYSAAVHRDTRRLAFYAEGGRGAPTNSTASFTSLAVQAMVENGEGAYHMNLSIGTPPLTFLAILHTGSDLVWTQCAPCTECFTQPTPLYDPSRSSTFSELPCTNPLCESLPTSFRRACNATAVECAYEYRYVVGFTAGYLATETLTLGNNASFPNVAFGCSTANGGHMDNTSGITGLGRSPLSLVSQLGVGRFSYCLRSDSAAGASPILFGSLANLTDVNVQSTPLVQNPAARHAPYYYVNLTGITIGTTGLPVTASTFGFTRSGGGSGRVIVDSGTRFTYLAKAGYEMLKQAFLSQTTGMTRVSGARFDFDLCFETGGGDVVPVPVLVPELTLRFAGGAEYAVPRRSYFDVVDEQGSVACLLVLPTGGVSVIGNVLQMDLHVLYDLDGGMLSFAPADCASI